MQFKVMQTSLYIKPALAYIISKLPKESQLITLGKTLDKLNSDQVDSLFLLAKEKELKLYHFKKTELLPRVEKVLGHINAFYPKTMLDIGTGRGVFLWPLLDFYPELDVTCIDVLSKRIEFLEHVRSGGISNITPELSDIQTTEFPDDSFDVVTFLETLEHIPNPEMALKNAFRMAKRAVILSVPSKEDDNPEHIHLLDQFFFKNTLANVSSNSVKFYYVLNHMIVVIIKKPP